MKLYLISQTENTTYDCYRSAVVAAETPEIARTMHPDGYSKPHDWRWDDCYTWVDDPKQVKVQELGEALPGTKRGVICTDFNGERNVDDVVHSLRGKVKGGGPQ